MKKNSKLNIYFHSVVDIKGVGGVPNYFRKIYSLFPKNAIIHKKENLLLTKIFRFLYPFLPVFINKKNSVIFSPNYKLPIFTFPKTPKAIMVHDLCHLIAPKTMRFGSFLLAKMIFPYCIRNADSIITTSQSVKKDIEKFYPCHKNKIKVIPIAGCIEKPKSFYPSHKIKKISQKKYILFVGTIEPRKNLFNLLSAYSKLPKELKTQHPLVLAGKYGWGKLDVNYFIKELKIKDYIIQLGYTSDNDLYFLYKNAYCLMLPSLYEGFGIPIIEAHKFGVPVITSNISSMPEVAGDAALFVNPFDAKSINKAILDLLEDTKLRDDLSFKAIKNAKKYDWNKTAQDTFALLKQLAKM